MNPTLNFSGGSGIGWKGGGGGLTNLGKGPLIPQNRPAPGVYAFVPPKVYWANLASFCAQAPPTV